MLKVKDQKESESEREKKWQLAQIIREEVIRTLFGWCQPVTKLLTMLMIKLLVGSMMFSVGGRK